MTKVKDLSAIVARMRRKAEALQAEATSCTETVRRMEELAALNEWTMRQSIEWAKLEKLSKPLWKGRR